MLAEQRQTWEPLRRFKAVAPGYFETMGESRHGGTRDHVGPPAARKGRLRDR